MTRPIKFRAWDGEVEEFIYSDQQYDDAWFEFKDGTLKAFALHGMDAGSIDEPPQPICDELEPVEMFIDILDQDGKKIYGGDILEGNNGVKAIVEWTQEFGRWSMRWSDRSTTPISWHVKHAIVIGNVHCGIARELLQTLKEG